MGEVGTIINIKAWYSFNKASNRNAFPLLIIVLKIRTIHIIYSWWINYLFQFLTWSYLTLGFHQIWWWMDFIDWAWKYSGWLSICNYGCLYRRGAFKVGWTPIISCWKKPELTLSED
jgi:hypothetical protein